MPSYRVILTIGLLRSGTAPQTLVPRAAVAARQNAVVEASDLAVVSGAARITVRFTGDDDEHALRVGQGVRRELQGLAEVVTWRVTLRNGSRWYPVSPG